MHLKSLLPRSTSRNRIFIYCAALLRLFPGELCAQSAIISEFLAANDTGLADEDGEHPDWIEIQALAPEGVDLDGWFLTDDPAILQKWRFPAVALEAGESLLVFASGKNRDAAGGPLHANFKLSAAGGYLALVLPDGQTAAHEYAGYPPQVEDVSYGIAQTTERFVLAAAGSPAAAWVPADGSLGLEWTLPGFAGAAWRAGRTGAGYDVEDLSAPAGELVNLALAGTASQSTIGYGGDPARAIDGDTNGDYGAGSVTHTADGDPAPYWELDLGAVLPLARIVLWNRSDCCSSRLTRFRISVYTDAEAEDYSEDFFADGIGFPPPEAGFEVELPPETAARFVRIERLGPSEAGELYLSLAEVQVFGLAGGGPAGGPENLARGKVATQSTTAFGGFASRAVDGNTDGVYSNNSVSHTHPSDANPFWQVDLGETRTLARVVLWNRTDCCAQRLSNFRLSVLDEAAAVVAQSDHFTDKGSPAGPSYEVALPAGTRGRFVRAARLGPDAGGENVLSFAEVEVFEAPAGYKHRIGLDLEAAMHGANSSAYLRVPFEAAEPSAFDVLRLRIQYDDGFLAYLNGVEVARRNAPEAPRWNAAAAADRPDLEAIAFEEFNITGFLGALQPGANVLAIHGLNSSAADADFLIVPELEALSVESTTPLFFKEPTPGAANVKPGTLGFVADTRFSHRRGFFDAPFDLEISSATEGATIRYTLDGGAPSAARGAVYAGPIRIATTTILRAAAFKDGFEPANVDTQTYIFPADVVRQTGAGFPASWGGTPADYPMDPQVVNDARYRDTIRDDIKAGIPSLSIVMDNADLFGPRGIYSNTEARGAAWEKACSMELIHPDGLAEDLQVDCGVRIFGFGWRSHSASMKHALRLMFKRKYGPGKLRYRFFPDFPVESFDSLVLRSQGSRGWNDFRPSIEQTCYIRDAWARYTEQAMGKLTTSSTYVHLYLNGLYWGLYNPVERPDAEFMNEHLGGPEEDYDALNARVGNIEVIDGSRADWDALIALAKSNAAGTLDGFQRMQHYLDVDDLIDYLMVQFYTANQDWVGANGNNMRVAGGAGPLGGFKCFSWDMEYSIWGVADNGLAVITNYDTPALLHARLRSNPEYRLRFADRARKHLFHGGALTPEAAGGRWRKLAEQIFRAVVGESARWGDRRREPPYTRDVEWARERDRLLNSFFPQRTGIFLSQLTQGGLYPSLAAPEFDRHGGAVPRGFELSMSAPAGEIHFTLDGSDPRLEGGALAPGAALYQSPIAIERSVRVKARARSGANWSALNEAVFTVDPPPALRITEIMYHPADPEPDSPFDADDFEFLELQNTGNEAIDLRGFRITGGVEFEFPPEAAWVLGPGALTLVVGNLTAFEERYPGVATALVAGEHSGRLENAGEALRLEGAFGEAILDFSYDDEWLPATDGEGRSLVIVDAALDRARWGEAASWRASAALHGSPGAGEAAPAANQLPGDANQDGRLNIADALALLGHLFLAQPASLPCGDGTLADAANRSLLDSNGDRGVNLPDAVHLLNYLFLGGPEPASGTICVDIPRCPASCSR
jgi:hypothetical protein